MILGKIDDVYACADAACAASAMDVIGEEGLYWKVECAFCGTGQTVKAIRGHLKPRAEEFRFSDGRFEGCTPEEAAAMPNGLIYLNWAARSHKRPAVRSACQTFLDSIPAAR